MLSIKGPVRNHGNGGGGEGGRGGEGEEGGRGGLSQVNGFAMSSRTLFVMVRFSIADVN